MAPGERGEPGMRVAAALTFGSLFAGIGGLDLGLERAGMQCRWQVEIDDYCNRVLAKHWPDVERHRDVRDCGLGNLGPVDLICGGFPCQPHSLAGRRKGKADSRNLWPEYLRIVRELRPTWVLGENVPGIRTTILDDILDDLENLGYATRTLDIPARAVGAPHLRHRFFIVAHAEGIRERSGLSGGDILLAGSAPGRNIKQCGAADVANAGRTERGEEPPEGCGDIGAHCLHGSRAQGAVGAGECPAAVANSDGTGRCEQRWTVPVCQEQFAVECSGWWETEPDVGRVVDGVPNRVDRLRCLGNAVVPQVAEWVGRRIAEAAL